MDEHHITVPRTARYFTLGGGPGVTQVWFACHGYGQLAPRFLERLAELDDGTRLLVAPEGLSRFYLSERADERRVGASWMTREDRLREIDDYVAYLDAVYAAVFARVDRGRVRVTALGFSQGAATVSRWAALGRSGVDRVVLWGGELPPDLDLAGAGARLRALEVTLVHGARDEYITPKIAAGIAERLRAHGVPHRVRSFDGGHELNAALLRDLASG